MFRTKFPAKAFDAQGQHIGPGPWLDLLRAANGVHHGFFGEPESVDAWWAGGSVEVYAHARIIHHTDESVSVVALDELGDQVLTDADALLRAKQAERQPADVAEPDDGI